MGDTVSGWTRNQQFALVSAVIYLLAGAAGFLATGFDDFFGDTTERLIILGLNPAHNIVHLLLGTIWLVTAFSPRAAEITNASIGGFLLVAFALGMMGGLQLLNVDNVAEPDNYLHLIYGLLTLAVYQMRTREEESGYAVMRG